MLEDQAPKHLPPWLEKDIISARHEVPVAPGRTETVIENFYSPHVLRWAITRWLESVPLDGDLTALRRTLPIVFEDTRTLHAYLHAPDAFAETYAEELFKVAEDRRGLAAVKRLLRRGPYGRWWTPQRWICASLVLAYAFALGALSRGV